MDQGGRELEPKQDDEVRVEPMPVGGVEQGAKVDAVDQLEGQVRAAVDLAKVDDADDVPVPQLRREHGLALKQLRERLVVGVERQNDLQADPLAETALAAPDRLEGLGRTADAEASHELVRSEMTFKVVGKRCIQAPHTSRPGSARRPSPLAHREYGPCDGTWDARC